MKNIKLLIIDPQNSFCNPDTGELYVPGAEKDMQRLSNFIDKYGSNISQIYVSLDCHHLLDIAHPLFWKNEKGEHPKPFTVITVKDVESKKWIPFDSNTKEAIKLLRNFAKVKHSLLIWPPHCLIGSPGYNVLEVLYNSLIKWERNNLTTVNYFEKGYNIFAENYSAFESVVPDSNDETTYYNYKLADEIFEENLDYTLVSGEASTHCVKDSMYSLLEHLDFESIKKIVLLEDTTSPVMGFEELQNSFFKYIKKQGIKISNTTDFGRYEWE